MAQQAIKLKLAGKSYSFKIESEKEELYRLAEKEVNQYVASIKQNNFQGWTDQDYLGMAALKFAIALLDLKQSREVGDEDLKRLTALDNELDRYLTALEPERCPRGRNERASGPQKGATEGGGQERRPGKEPKRGRRKSRTKRGA